MTLNRSNKQTQLNRRNVMFSLSPIIIPLLIVFVFVLFVIRIVIRIVIRSLVAAVRAASRGEVKPMGIQFYKLDREFIVKK